MSQVALFKQAGKVMLLVPTPEALALFGMAAICRKDVPPGQRFKILDDADLPKGPQESWVVDDAELTDGVGNNSNDWDGEAVAVVARMRGDPQGRRP